MTTLIPDEVVPSNSEVDQNGIGHVLLPTGAQTPTGIVPREKRRKAMKDGDEEEVGKQKWPAVFFHPALCSQKFSA